MPGCRTNKNILADGSFSLVQKPLARESAEARSAINAYALGTKIAQDQVQAQQRSASTDRAAPNLQQQSLLWNSIQPVSVCPKQQ